MWEKGKYGQQGMEEGCDKYKLSSSTEEVLHQGLTRQTTVTYISWVFLI
jgi:hypothetical protein